MNDITYLTKHYDEKIKRIKDIGAPLNFVFITDQHNRMNEWDLRWHPEKNPYDFELAVNAIDSIQYILDRCPEISCVISGGDIGNDYNHDPDEVHKSQREVMEALYRLSVPVYCCIGNHDDALGAATDNGFDNTKFVVLPDEMHKLCMKYNPTKENYFYIDFPSYNYRFVFLNTSDKPYCLNKEGQYEYPWRIEISEKQAAWFERDALNTKARIIVFSHVPLRTAGIFGTENSPQCIKPYDDLFNGPRVYYAAKQCKNVVAMIAGHVHYDNLLYDDHVVIITTMSSLMQEWDVSCLPRKVGTITETAFDVFSITDDVIYITRFGAGNDRVARIMPRE